MTSEEIELIQSQPIPPPPLYVADFSFNKYTTVAFGQWLALWYKSFFSYYIHGMKFILLQLFAPFIVVGIVFIIIAAVDNNLDNNRRKPLAKIDSASSVLLSCRRNAVEQQLPCYTLAYFSNGTTGSQIINRLISKNKVRSEEVQSFSSEEELYVTMLNERSRYSVGVSFTQPFEYTIFYNDNKHYTMNMRISPSPSYAMELQIFIDSEILLLQ